MRLMLVPAAALILAATVSAASQQPWIFTPADLQVLEECDALDQHFETRALVEHDTELQQYLTALVAPVLPPSPLEHVQWRFRILHDPNQNAVSLPNGSLYVSTGLLARAENDDQLLALVAHEIAHVENRDAYRMARSLKKKTVAAAATGPFGGIAGMYLAQAIAGNPAEQGILDAISHYSAAVEQAADQSAIRALKNAGRDPAQLLRWSQIAENRLELESHSFWRDQLDPKDRTRFLKTRAGLDHDPVQAGEASYVERLRPVILENIRLDLETRRFRSAVAGAQRLVASRPEDAVALFWLGESYRALGPRQERLPERASTATGMRAAYREQVARTEEDEAAQLAGTPEGRTALEAHLSKAEELFHRAAAHDASFADPYFGLGAVYAQQGKAGPAVEAYTKYMTLCPRRAARERAQRRVDQLLRASGTGTK